MEEFLSQNDIENDTKNKTLSIIFEPSTVKEEKQKKEIDLLRVESQKSLSITTDANTS